MGIFMSKDEEYNDDIKYCLLEQIRDNLDILCDRMKELGFVESEVKKLVDKINFKENDFDFVLTVNSNTYVLPEEVAKACSNIDDYINKTTNESIEEVSVGIKYEDDSGNRTKE